MQAKNQEYISLCNYLDELGLGGHFLLIGGSEALESTLSGQFANDKLRLDVPETGEALSKCSVLILDEDEGTSIEAILKLMMGSNTRPLIVVLSGVSLTTKYEEQLYTLGYQLPPAEVENCPFRIVEHAQLDHKKYFDVAQYWERRYASGRNSGSGSYGRLAKFKAQFLNDFVSENEIQTVLELGCGDGAQLSLSEYPEYTGLDISPTVVEQCRRIFDQDPSKQFYVYDPEKFSPGSFRAELCLSLDVIYHLSNDDVYRLYLDHLFSASSRFVIIYSNSEDGSRAGVNESAGYVRFRNVLEDLKRRKPEWSLVSAIPNRFPFSAVNPSQTSFADFFVFERQSGESCNPETHNNLSGFLTKKILNTLMVSDENTKYLAEDVSEANKKLNALSEAVSKLSEQRRLEALLNDASEEIRLLQAELKTAKSSYRSANTKYRDACKQISALKSSNTYKAGLYVKAAGASKVGIIKLPVRLWRLKRKRQKSYLSRVNLLRVLRSIKWSVLVPVATRLGVPYSKVAYVSAPRMLKKFLRRGEPSAIPTEAAQTFTPPSKAAQEVSILGWPTPPDNDKPLALAIMDEFTEGCFGEDLRLIQPRPDNWYGLANKYPPAMVFIESAWKGNGGSWQYRVGSYGIKPGRELENMTGWARQEGIPSVFWNKEDPVHHDKFMEAAKLADHIFTTDENMIGSYKKRTGNNSVYALPFAAQPALHKPAPLSGRIQKSCFAGSWYGNRHAERGEAMKWLLKTAHKYGLEIFDRNHGTGIFPFPSEYQNDIQGSLSYLELCKEYPRYRVFLNVNSVTDSPTMFSRRVFELMACGTPVVSTYARGIESLFESDAVWQVRTEAEAEQAIHTLMTDDAEWRRRSLAGIREVFSAHTYAHRLNTVFETIGSSERIPTQPELLLVAFAENSADVECLLGFVNNQSYRQFRLLIESGAKSLETSIPNQVEVVKPGELRKKLTEHGNSDFAGVGWIAPYNSYGEHYLQDLVNAMMYQPNAEGWAKATREDAFSLAAETNLTASIWRPAIFRQQWTNADDQVISSSGLYCTDTDQFSSGLLQKSDGKH